MSKIQLKYAAVEPYFQKVNLVVEKGASLAITGAYRNELLQTIGCFRVLTNGTYRLEYHQNETKDVSDLAVLRQTKMGYLPAKDEFLKDETVLENIQLPFFFQTGTNKLPGARKQRLDQLSKLIGIHELLGKKAVHLNDFQIKCMALIRACLHAPSILLIEEPEKALTEAQLEKFIQCLRSVKAEGVTLIISSENPTVCASCQDVFELTGEQILSN